MPSLKTTLLAILPILAPLVASAPAELGGRAQNATKLPITNPNVEGRIDGRYVVLYHDKFDDKAIDSREMAFTAAIQKRNVKRSLDGEIPFGIESIKMQDRRMALVHGDDKLIQDIDSADEVCHVEADFMVSTRELVAQTNAQPGLARLSSARPGAEAYQLNLPAGKGINAFVIDTGVRATHADFEGRASQVANFVNDVDTDEHGHGSHVAGIIAGTTFGVAKNATIKAVKVLNAQGSGPNSAVIRGLEFVMKNVQEKKLQGQSLVNMSLGGPFSAITNRAVEALTKAGIPVIVAAGNENQDTQNTSPGSAPNAITVGAIDPRNDQRAEFSNFGALVDINAAGVGVLSVGIKSDTDTATKSGTSMASPHVAGLAAYLMARHTFSAPTDLEKAIKDLATQTGAKVVNNAEGTTSLIANNQDKSLTNQTAPISKRSRLRTRSL